MRPGCALAALVLAAGLWLRGPGESSSWVSKVSLGTLPSERPCSVRFPSLFARCATAFGSSGGAPWLAAPWPCLSCFCACCRALATRPWRVVLMGFEGTVRHPVSQFSALFGSLFARRGTALGSSGERLGWLRPGRALAALVLAAGLWLRGPGKSS